MEKVLLECADKVLAKDGHSDFDGFVEDVNSDDDGEDVNMEVPLSLRGPF